MPIQPEEFPQDVLKESLNQEVVLELYADPFAPAGETETRLIVSKWAAHLTSPVFRNESRTWERLRAGFLASLTAENPNSEEQFDTLQRLLRSSLARWFPHEIVLLSRLEKNFGTVTPASFARVHTMFVYIEPRLELARISDLQILGRPSVRVPNDIRTHILYRNQLLLQNIHFQSDDRPKFIRWIEKFISGSEKTVPPSLVKRISHVLERKIKRENSESAYFGPLYDLAVEVVSRLHPRYVLSEGEDAASLLSQNRARIQSALSVMNDRALNYVTRLLEVLERDGQSAEDALRESFGPWGEFIEALAFNRDVQVNSLISLLTEQVQLRHVILYQKGQDDTTYYLAVSPLFAQELKRLKPDESPAGTEDRTA